MALPSLPAQGQDPWFTDRTNWDLAVKTELEGRLSEAQLSATIADQSAEFLGSNPGVVAAAEAAAGDAVNAYAKTFAAHTPQAPGVQFADETGRALSGAAYTSAGWLTDAVVGNVRARMRRNLVAYEPVAPTSSMTTGLHQILAGCADNGLTALDSWYPGTGQILKWGAAGKQPHMNADTSIMENAFRAPAGMAYAMALCVSEGITTTASTAALIAGVERYAGSLLKAHRANNSNAFPTSAAAYDSATFPSWGADEGVAYVVRDAPRGGPDYQWQPALWVALAARAVWLLRDDLTPGTVAAALAALQWEADRFTDVTPVYWTHPEGWVITPGDTRAEENSWNGLCLAVAYAWTGEAKYRQAAIKFALASQQTRQNVELQDVVSGVNLVELGGWNQRDDFLVENHNTIHPNYVVAPVMTWGLAAGCFAEREGRIPHAFTFNQRHVYNALQKVVIPAGTADWNRSTTIYLPGDSKTAYPTGDTLDPSCDKYAMDVIAHCLGDSSAASWASLHRAYSLTETSAGTFAAPGEAHWSALNAGAALELASRIDSTILEEA